MPGYYNYITQPQTNGTKNNSKTPAGKLIMYVDETTTAFPTTRGDGSLLQNQDYVLVKSGAVCPFTIKGLTFQSKDDIAFYYNGDWHKWTGSLQISNGLIIDDTKQESISGTATTQQQVNKEIKEILEPEDGCPKKRILAVDEGGMEVGHVEIANNEDIEKFLGKVLFYDN